jgi:serine/threonine-protein phosphatase 2A regulatory subunit A
MSGPNRSYRELVPFILEILEECDNEDDFLVVLAQQIRDLEPYIL